MRGSRLLAAAALLALLPAAACRQSPPQATGEIETEEVAGPVDEFLTTEFDQQRARIEDDFSGVMPGGFPSEFPLYSPSSVVDFGDVGGGWKQVTLYTPDPRAEVESRMAALLGRAGWAASGGAWRRGGSEVRVSYDADSAGTEIRLEFVPGR